MSTRKRSAPAGEEPEATPRPDWQIAAQAPWLAAPREAIRASAAAGRLPHALLLAGPAGIGKGALAEWIARYALCEHAERAPCGVCTSCVLHAAGTHPDLHRAGPEPGKKQIAVDTVRALIGVLALKGYRGPRRVGIVEPADFLNTAGANAFLKTLEEPGDGTLLILVAARTDRLPATILSRCQKVAVAAPERAAALAWLAQRGEGDWPGLLDLLGEAPLAALAAAGLGAQDIPADMSQLVAALRRGPVDLVAAAEVFAKEFPDLRLRWIERWATALVYAAAGVTAGGGTIGANLPPPTRKRHIEALFNLVDEARRGQGLLRGSVNVPLLLESVLNELAACVRTVGP